MVKKKPTTHYEYTVILRLRQMVPERLRESVDRCCERMRDKRLPMAVKKFWVFNNPHHFVAEKQCCVCVCVCDCIRYFCCKSEWMRDICICVIIWSFVCLVTLCMFSLPFTFDFYRTVLGTNNFLFRWCFFCFWF